MVTVAGAGDVATAYGAAGTGGKARHAGAEIWLRGNVRPVLAAGAAVCGGLAVMLAAAVASRGAAAVWPLAAALAMAAVVAAALAVVAAGPRLGRRGDALLVRLSPWTTAEVPLAVVECVFPGSQPLGGAVLHDVHAAEGGPAEVPGPTRRVGTLVIRFAERARDWRERPTFAPWGTWHDGHAIIDGRWCEPLTAEVARTISQRLLVAKREAADGEAAP
ncbi:MAG: hypothetical protein ACKON7_05925 [Planctomycetaceae bacterium]